MVDGAVGVTTTIGVPATTISRVPTTTVPSADSSTKAASVRTSAPVTTTSAPPAAMGAVKVPEENGPATVTLGLGAAVLAALGAVLSIRRRRSRMDAGGRSGLESGAEPLP